MVASTNIGEQEAHTPEPWFVHEVVDYRIRVCGDLHAVDEDDDGYHDTSCVRILEVIGNATGMETTRANASRLVSAINATTGIPTEALERIAAEPCDRERLRMLGDAGYDYRTRFEEIQNVNVQL